MAGAEGLEPSAKVLKMPKIHLPYTNPASVNA